MARGRGHAGSTLLPETHIPDSRGHRAGDGSAGTSRGVLHISADFVGVAAARLGDADLMSMLLVAGAAAAGLNSSGPPVIRLHSAGGLSAVLPLEGWQMSIHTLPDQELAMLDILTTSPHDPQKALDVFTRRLVAREVRVERRQRGA